jgi:hypothetical protein
MRRHFGAAIAAYRQHRDLFGLRGALHRMQQRDGNLQHG